MLQYSIIPKYRPKPGYKFALQKLQVAIQSPAVAKTISMCAVFLVVATS